MSAEMSDDWREKLRGKGYRLTPQRELILDAVDTLGHATPDEVLVTIRPKRRCRIPGSTRSVIAITDSTMASKCLRHNSAS